MIPYQTYYVRKNKLAGKQPEIFQGRFSETRALDKHVVKNARNILEFFS